jgi:hypothetical protein
MKGRFSLNFKEGNRMYINMTGLITWWVLAFIISLGASIMEKDDTWEFVRRFSFVGFANTLVFIFLTYAKVF